MWYQSLGYAYLGLVAKIKMMFDSRGGIKIVFDDRGNPKMVLKGYKNARGGKILKSDA